MFNKILIANRGEIAVRIIRTAKQLDIDTVAVFSDADAHAPHVKLADEAIYIGLSPARQSYLDGDKIIDAAKRSGADAIHPGYGFLSENANFAAACASAGISFIGPSAEVIRTMGSKRDAKSLMAQHGVPVVPGFFGDVNDKELALEAEKIGFPVLIKASAGGGGRGMRLVRKPENFDSALQSARREAKSAFADDSVLLEKYIERPRHIEVQIFGDTHGNIIHLFERDCSVQRRYQKLIEEAPASALNEEQRRHIQNAAVTAGTAASYVGAGTVEFVLDEGGDIYFIEMNTRLQVEHPVTEMITGRDLVALQLEVAAGACLPDQSEITASGHAIELRLCAEDADNDFAPSTGRIFHFSLAAGEVRVDHGVETGFSISPYYDSMIAKLIVHAEDRTTALRKAITALAQTEVVGVTTNGDFLRRILGHQHFIDGTVDTHFIEHHKAELLGATPAPSDPVLALAVIFLVARRDNGAKNNTELYSPWDINDAFRLNLNYRELILLSNAGYEYAVAVEHHKSGHYVIELPSGEQKCIVERIEGSNIAIRIGDVRHRGRVIVVGSSLDVFTSGRHCTLTETDPLHVTQSADAAMGGLTAPMPGTVLEVFVETGQEVTSGTPLLLIEAMKIEHTITAPFDGTITEIRFKCGDQITAEGLELVTMEPS